MPKGILKRIHINQHVIKSNTKTGKTDAVVTVKTYKKNRRTNHVDILDPASGAVLASIVYRPTSPLSCGARVWVETRNPIKLNDEVVE